MSPEKDEEIAASVGNGTLPIVINMAIFRASRRAMK
jgi:hypothetical protein